MGELFKNSIFRKLVFVCNGVGQGLMICLTGAEPSLSSARMIFSACVSVVSWNSVFLTLSCAIPVVYDILLGGY